MRWPWGAPWIEHFAYDPNGNLIATGNAHVEVTREFDAEGLLLKEIQQHASGDCFIIESAYDAAGNRVLRKSNKGNQIRYAFDLLDEPAEIRINDAAPITIRRDALGQITEEELAPGLKRSYRYNADGLMTEQALRKDATELFRTAYRYDPAGNLTERHDSEFGTDVYLYDPMGRILAHTDPRGAIHRFLNDPAGDRLLTRIAESDGWKREGEYQGTRYRFNRAGNLVRKDDAGKRLDLAWDASQRLIASHRTDAGGRRVTTTYAYDPLGRRLFKETDGRRTWFGWDGSSLVMDADIFKMREFIYSPDSFIPLVATTYEGGQYFYLNSSNGRPSRLLNSKGESLWSEDQEIPNHVAQVGIEGEAQINPIRFQGQYEDLETGFFYNNSRYFDPFSSSYISQDQIGLVGGLNLYELGFNTNAWIDPLGFAALNDSGYSVYALYHKGGQNPYYIGITRQNVDARISQHGKIVGNYTSARFNPRSDTYRVYRTNLLHKEARGWEQYYIETKNTRAKFPGNVQSSFKKSRSDYRGKVFKREYNRIKKMMKGLRGCK